MKKVGVISLGCDKNRIDTENMLSYLSADGYVITGDPSDADIIVVNTCAFIESAKVEAIETILEMADYKVNGKCTCLVVTGCLPQRYMDEVKAEIPEIDIIVGTASYRELPELISSFHGEQIAKANDRDKRDFTSERILTTPYHYAYLKIAEGCDNKCTYCAIPSIRGKYTSRPIDELVSEAEGLIRDYGVKELIVVAQDVTKYGIDIYGRLALIELLERLTALDIRWVRLLYCYPETVSDELIQFVSSNDKMAKYLDIPMQHASDQVLKRMNRRINNAELRSLVERIRNIDNKIAIRTTFIVGFPEETEEQYNELVEFVKEMRFDKCGFFAYSLEDGTPASRLPNQLDESLKAMRVERLYSVQNAIMAEKSAAKIGEKVLAVYEDIDYDNSMFILRASDSAPEIDSVIRATADIPMDIGELYTVELTGTDGVDFTGVVVRAEIDN